MVADLEERFPAHAGIDPVRGHPLHIGIPFPRTRGDRPSLWRWRSLTGPVSPHTRG